MEAAAQIFETHGYAAGTTNRIAKAAGVSIGTLYQYFSSKESLAVALLERHVEETHRCLMAWVAHMLAENHNLREALDDYIKGILAVHAQRPRLLHMLLEETPLPDHLHQVLLEAEQQSVRTMAGFLRTFPEAKHADLERAAYLVIHAVESLTHHFAAHPGHRTMSQEELGVEITSMLWNYLSRK